MTDATKECVESVLEDNPGYDEPRAYAICKSQQALAVESLADVATISELGLNGDDLDQLSEDSSDWIRVEAGVWALDEDDAGVVYDPDAVDVQLESGAATESLAGIPDDALVVEGLPADARSDLEEEYDVTIREQVAQQQAGEMDADVFQIVATEDDDQDLSSDLMGIGVDFPNAGVYVDWNIDAWPDDEQLEEAHVSDYGTLADLEQATGGVVEPLATVGAHATATGDDVAEQAGTTHWTLGTDGVAGDEDDVHAFLDDLVDAGADVWQLRNDELYTWPEDDGFPTADPYIHVAGIEEEELRDLIEEHDVGFMRIEAADN